MSSVLDSRYGRAPHGHRRDRRLLLLVAGGLGLALVSWAVWVGLGGPAPLIETSDIRHSVIDDNTVSVTFEASIPVGSASSCAVEALNESFTIVGWKVVDLPPSTQLTRSFTEVVHTTERSNTGLIYRCWLT